MEIAALGPKDHAVDPIEQLLAAGKLAPKGQRRVEHARLERVFLRNSRPPFDLHVAVSVVGEAGFPLLTPPAFHDVGVRGPCRPQVILVDRAIWTKSLRILQRHFRTTRTLDRKAHAPSVILAEIKNKHAGLRLTPAPRRQKFRRRNGWYGLGPHDPAGTRHPASRHPSLGAIPAGRAAITIIVANIAPAHFLQARVVKFAVEEVVGAGRTGRGHPDPR